jgi:hypothetical protein
MRRALTVLLAITFLLPISASCNDVLYDASSEIIEIVSFDGYTINGRLSMPEGQRDVSKLVIFINGSGANTYLNRRPGFNFFDIFADEFQNLGIAFFSYSTRGVDLGI